MRANDRPGEKRCELQHACHIIAMASHLYLDTLNNEIPDFFQ